MNEVAHAGSGPQQPKPHAFFFDLAIYLSVMFLIRNVYVPELGFLANGLFWSLTTLAVAAWRMRARRVTWAELGLCMPPSFARAFVATLAVFGLAVGFVIVFNLIGDQLFPNLAPDQSTKDLYIRHA